MGLGEERGTYNPQSCTPQEGLFPIILGEGRSCLLGCKKQGFQHLPAGAAFLSFLPNPPQAAPFPLTEVPSTAPVDSISSKIPILGV